MKFSIVIPVYNVEKYIAKCLDSVLNQSYNNFEVIVVNDGTKDNSQKIIDEYVKKDNRIKSYIKPNGGLSDARNFGVKYITGDYLIFLDSDDYIEKDLLLNISKISNIESNIENNDEKDKKVKKIKKDRIDIIKYNLKLVDEEGTLIRCAREFKINGLCTCKELYNAEYFEPAWTYCYNVSFWRENNFMYEVGKVHEDFGLTPYITLLAKKIYMLDYFGYNYVQRLGSIMNGSEKVRKRAEDMLYHYTNLTNKICKLPHLASNDECKSLTLKFITNNIIDVYSWFQNDKDRNEYVKKLKKLKIYRYLLDDTIGRKFKKILIKICPSLYFKYIYTSSLRKNNNNNK